MWEGRTALRICCSNPRTRVGSASPCCSDSEDDDAEDAEADSDADAEPAAAARGAGGGEQAAGSEGEEGESEEEEEEERPQHDDPATDSSEDERAPRNTIGQVPLEWYNEEEHIG